MLVWMPERAQNGHFGLGAVLAKLSCRRLVFRAPKGLKMASFFRFPRFSLFWAVLRSFSSFWGVSSYFVVFSVFSYSFSLFWAVLRGFTSFWGVSSHFVVFSVFLIVVARLWSVWHRFKAFRIISSCFFHNILAPLYLVLPRFGPFRIVLFGFVAFLNLFQRVSLRLCVFLAFLYGFVPFFKVFQRVSLRFRVLYRFLCLVSHRLQLF